MKYLIASAAIFLLLLYNTYLFFAKDFSSTLLFGILILVGTLLSLLSVKWLGHYYLKMSKKRPKKVLFEWDERFGVQVFRWFNNMRKAERLLLIAMAAIIIVLLRCAGTFAVIFFIYSYVCILVVESHFRLKNKTFITKQGVYRATPKGLKLLVHWDEIASVKLHAGWFIYMRRKGFPYYYYYLSPEKEKINLVHDLILEHRK